MVMQKRGRVENGRIIFSHPLLLPEGVEVKVQIEYETKSTEAPDAAIATSDFFGMWNNRDDMKNSVEWVEKERAKWQRNDTPQG